MSRRDPNEADIHAARIEAARELLAKLPRFGLAVELENGELVIVDRRPVKDAREALKHRARMAVLIHFKTELVDILRGSNG